MSNLILRFQSDSKFGSIHFFCIWLYLSWKGWDVGHNSISITSGSKPKPLALSNRSASYNTTHVNLTLRTSTYVPHAKKWLESGLVDMLRTQKIDASEHSSYKYIYYFDECILILTCNFNLLAQQKINLQFLSKFFLLNENFGIIKCNLEEVTKSKRREIIFWRGYTNAQIQTLCGARTIWEYKKAMTIAEVRAGNKINRCALQIACKVWDDHRKINLVQKLVASYEWEFCQEVKILNLCS